MPETAVIERLLEEVESFPDPAARQTATDLVTALLDLYGDGLGRVVALVADRDDDGELAAALAADELVAHLLLLHGLHPQPVEVRVRGALDDVRPYLESHGGNVELLGVRDGVVHLQLEGSCKGCPSSAATLKLAIEDAIHQAAPDIQRVEAEGAVAPPAPPVSSLIQLEVTPAVQRRAWTSIDGMPELADGARVLEAVGGAEVLFLRLDGRVFAYRPACPGCGESLADAGLSGTELACARCGHRYDVRRAGRCLDAPQLHLDPVPLLPAAEGRVKVAAGPAA
jgi:Fe-S cluster biogenesis protein NfuA/nitrite reductase/ring-hydroxylating ferredoxin subunit